MRTSIPPSSTQTPRPARPPIILPARHLLAPPGRLMTPPEWIDYFRANAHRAWGVQWHRGAGVTEKELAAIKRSLQAWQLGETSDGSHLRAAAARYAARVGEPAFAEAVEYFIREEQRHGEMIGRFLDLAGVGRIKADWGDRLFRAARYCLRDMEVWTTPVVMVETLALVYYNAVRRATRSAVLGAVCARILADEVPHLRFQCERLATIFRHRSPFALKLTMLAHRLCFLVVMLLVWAGHRKALRAGGYGWRRYWRASWDRMGASWKRMDPRRYAWPGRLVEAAVPHRENVVASPADPYTPIQGVLLWKSFLPTPPFRACRATPGLHASEGNLMASKTKAPPAPAPSLPTETPPPGGRPRAALLTTEQRLEGIESMRQRVNGYAEYMRQSVGLRSTSSEAREQAIAAFYDRMATFERELSRIEEGLRLG
jgi:hypothetical protein